MPVSKHRRSVHARRRPRAGRASAVQPITGLLCPHCPHVLLDQPGFAEWARRFTVQEGYAPPPAPPYVPDWAWWWCPACRAGGVMAPPE